MERRGFVVSLSIAALFSLGLVTSPPSLSSQPKPSAAADDHGIQDAVKACASGTSMFTPAQCSFVKHAFDAERQLNQLVDSGAYAKLPKPAQQTLLALVDALDAALPLVKTR